MDSQLLRLRYKGKIVGYKWELPLAKAVNYANDLSADLPFNVSSLQIIEIYAKDLHSWRAWSHYKQITFDSFDPSIKQGDEWFFEGDECAIIDSDFGEHCKGILKFNGRSWYLEIGENINFNRQYLYERDTLTLIKRAV